MARERKTTKAARSRTMKALHRKAKAIQKKNPGKKYRTCLKMAAK